MADQLLTISLTRGIAGPNAHAGRGCALLQQHNQKLTNGSDAKSDPSGRTAVFLPAVAPPVECSAMLRGFRFGVSHNHASVRHKGNPSLRSYPEQNCRNGHQAPTDQLKTLHWISPVGTNASIDPDRTLLRQLGAAAATPVRRDRFHG